MSVPGLFMGVEPGTFDLPHPCIHVSAIRIVHRVLTRAFEILRDRGAPLGDALEDDITDALLGVIENNVRQTGSVRGFDDRTFDRVDRHVQVTSVDGRSRTTPDLVFRLSRDGTDLRVLSTQDGLFIECKPVDESHPAWSDYCAEGLLRFVHGRYAWAMQDVMMVGYARGGRTLMGTLGRALKDHVTELQVSRSLERVPGPQDLHRSVHTRPFPWPEGKGPATAITVYHAWYDCDP